MSPCSRRKTYCYLKNPNISTFVFRDAGCAGDLVKGEGIAVKLTIQRSIRFLTAGPKGATG